MKTKRICPVLIGALFFAAGGELAAQSAPSPAVVRDDQVVELNPFVVQNDKDSGYLAANTLAGSRLNTSLKDTPASISVFNG